MNRDEDSAVKRVIVIGNGRPAQECLSVLAAHPQVDIRLLVAESKDDMAQRRLMTFCKQRELNVLVNDGSLETPEITARIATTEPDLLFSINNFQILRPPLLALAPRGAINFHNGPIPRYRGMNAPSWAIWNGEKTHGVTWHYMETEIDSGDIAATESFTLSGRETGLSLTLQCIEVGVKVLEEQLAAMLNGRRTPVPNEESTYYAGNQFPNGGLLDMHWSHSQVDRLLRATDFRPFPNPFTYARVAFAGGELIVNEVKDEGPNLSHTPGEIIQANDDALILACGDRKLRVSQVMSAPDAEASVGEMVDALGLVAGQRAVS